MNNIQYKWNEIFVPDIPTPIWAVFIIDTSFAPSPIANVTAYDNKRSLHPSSFFHTFLFLLTRSTTSAFCNGVTRQQMTALHLHANSRKVLSNRVVRANPRESPLITMATPSPSLSSGEGDPSSIIPDIFHRMNQDESKIV